MPKVGFSWFKACFLEYYKQQAPLFHIFTHSPAMTGDYYFKAMDNLLAFISKHDNINFKFASEIKEYPVQNFKTDFLAYLSNPNKEIIKTVFKKVLIKYV